MEKTAHFLLCSLKCCPAYTASFVNTVAQPHFLKSSSYFTLQWKWLVISNVVSVPGACSILLLSGQLTGVGSARWWSQAGARALLACQTRPWQRRAR